MKNGRRSVCGPAMTSSIKAIAAFALIIVAYIGSFAFWSEERGEENRGWVTHTYVVVEKLQAVQIDISQAEAGQWGYLLTGRDKYLEPYQAGLNQLRQDMEDVQYLTRDNPRQQESVGRLQGMIAARLTELSDGIEVRNKSGLLAGVEAVAFGNTGGKWMAKIGALVDEMRRAEGQLLVKRLDNAAASTRRTKRVIVCGDVLAILILLIAGVVIQGETEKRGLAEGELKHVNERLERQSAELWETNVELESFAYSVAHDLRAPLRHIAGYSNMLSEDYGPQFDGEGRRWLEKLVEGSQRMGRLVDDLLSLSRTGRQELSLQVTPLDALLRQVVEELGVEGSGREIEWRIGELSSAECDPGLMKQVFVNLLSNAVKYTGKREHAVIEVGQTMQNDERVVFVRDNGVGFEMQYAGKLFGVFQRLHKAGDFEGTGVGLAIVQRIVRKHGGRIWAEAELNQGATFFFTLGSPGKNERQEIEAAMKDEVMHV